jgi:hypothetical protein
MRQGFSGSMIRVATAGAAASAVVSVCITRTPAQAPAGPTLRRELVGYAACAVLDEPLCRGASLTHPTKRRRSSSRSDMELVLGGRKVDPPPGNKAGFFFSSARS